MTDSSSSDSARDEGIDDVGVDLPPSPMTCTPATPVQLFDKTVDGQLGFTADRASLYVGFIASAETQGRVKLMKGRSPSELAFEGAGWDANPGGTDVAVAAGQGLYALVYHSGPPPSRPSDPATLNLVMGGIGESFVGKIADTATVGPAPDMHYLPVVFRNIAIAHRNKQGWGELVVIGHTGAVRHRDYIGYGYKSGVFSNRLGRKGDRLLYASVAEDPQKGYVGLVYSYKHDPYTGLDREEKEDIFSAFDVTKESLGIDVDGPVMVLAQRTATSSSGDIAHQDSSGPSTKPWPIPSLRSLDVGKPRVATRGRMTGVLAHGSDSSLLLTVREDQSGLWTSPINLGVVSQAELVVVDPPQSDGITVVKIFYVLFREKGAAKPIKIQSIRCSTPL